MRRKKVAIPTKREDLMAMGYVFDNEATCRDCHAPIEWWITPKGKKMPMRVVEVKDETKVFPQPVLRYDRVPHFVDCPNYERKKK
jgi:hypothetical protein